MKRVAAKAHNEELEAIESLRRLFKAGVELGVAEAVRRIAAFAPAPGEGKKKGGVQAILASPAIAALVQSIRNDPSSVLHLAKEVWSRGGPKEKGSAAEAIGKGLGFFAPHRAIDAAKDLASMARSGREADLVGRKAIGPVLARSPAMLDRVKKFLNENERFLRQAAVAGLVSYVARKRKYVALGAEILLLIAEEHEKEIRALVRWGFRRLMEVDPKATAKAVAAWVRENPSTERIQTAAGYLAKKAGDVRLMVERGVIGALVKFNGNGTGTKPAKSDPKTSKKPRVRRTY